MEKKTHGHASRDCAIPPRPEERGFPRNSMIIDLNHIQQTQLDVENAIARQTKAHKLYSVVAAICVPLILLIAISSVAVTSGILALMAVFVLMVHGVILIARYDASENLDELIVTRERLTHDRDKLRATLI